MTNILDSIVANATILAIVFAGASAIFAGISAIVAAKAARDSTSAIILQREAIRAETFVDLLNYEREIDFSSCMDTIRGLQNEECRDYLGFCNSQPDKDRLIRKAVDFLNHIAHLIRHEYITPKHFLALYTSSIEACQEKLLGKGMWLEGLRKKAGSPYYYQNFECLCNNLDNLWDGKKFDWPEPQIQAPRDMHS